MVHTERSMMSTERDDNVLQYASFCIVLTLFGNKLLNDVITEK